MREYVTNHVIVRTESSIDEIDNRYGPNAAVAFGIIKVVATFCVWMGAIILLINFMPQYLS